MAQLGVKVRADLLQEVDSVQVVLWCGLVAVDADGKILGHEAGLNGLDTGLLKSLTPFGQSLLFYRSVYELEKREGPQWRRDSIPGVSSNLAL